MRIGIIIAFEKNLYAGTLRPFINWTKILKDEHDITIILFQCSKELTNLIRDIYKDINILESSKLDNIKNFIKNKNIDLIIGDDYFPRLKLITDIKKDSTCKSIIYVHVLFGFNSINRVSCYSSLPFMQKMLLKGSTLVPFKLLTKDYVNRLNNHDIIIPNSKNVRLILQLLYGIDTELAIYPPIDTDIFKNNSIQKSSKDILIYLGSNAGDTDMILLQDIISNLEKFSVNIFGNKKLTKFLINKFSNVITNSNLSDMEMANLYSKNILTICPQRFEMFGYVPVESMACGTPVLALDLMGPSETIINGKTGWLANGDKDLIIKLRTIIQYHSIIEQLEEKSIIEHVINNFSTDISTKKLLRIINEF